MDGEGITQGPAPRAIVVAIPEESLLEYLTGRRRLSRVPDDARIVNAWIFHRERRIRLDENSRFDAFLMLRLEHPSFAEVAPGTRLPTVTAKFRRLPKR